MDAVDGGGETRFFGAFGTRLKGLGPVLAKALVGLLDNSLGGEDEYATVLVLGVKSCVGRRGSLKAAVFGVEGSLARLMARGSTDAVATRLREVDGVDGAVEAGDGIGTVRVGARGVMVSFEPSQAVTSGPFETAGASKQET